MGEADGEGIVEGSGYQRGGGEVEDMNRAVAEEEVEEGEEHGVMGNSSYKPRRIPRWRRVMQRKLSNARMWR